MALPTIQSQSLIPSYQLTSQEIDALTPSTALKNLEAVRGGNLQQNKSNKKVPALLQTPPSVLQNIASFLTGTGPAPQNHVPLAPIPKTAKDIRHKGRHFALFGRVCTYTYLIFRTKKIQQAMAMALQPIWIDKPGNPKRSILIDHRGRQHGEVSKPDMGGPGGGA